MHAMLLVTLSRSHARTSQAARRIVYHTLYRIPELVHADDGAHEAIGDWLVIGGRFSGYLSHGRATTWPKATYRRLIGVRDELAPFGFEDDAVLVDAELYQRHLLPFAGESVHYNTKEAYLAFLDLDTHEVAERFIGQKWLVVVDLHS